MAVWFPASAPQVGYLPKVKRIFGPTDHVIELADGRKLGYAEYGDSQGTPLIYNHGGLSSRLDVRSADPVAREMGVRLIAPDRPGVGLSDRLPGRRLIDWPKDLAHNHYPEIFRTLTVHGE